MSMQPDIEQAVAQTRADIARARQNLRALMAKTDSEPEDIDPQEEAAEDAADRKVDARIEKGDF